MASEPVQAVNLSRLISRFRHIGRDMFSKSLMDEIGMFVISQIQIRTAEGKDVKGIEFAPYATGYKAFRSRKGRPVGKVNLFFTGSMRSSMTHEATDDTTRIFFMDTVDKSGAHNPVKAYGLNRKRNFFALSQHDQEEIERMVREHVAAILAG